MIINLKKFIIKRIINRKWNDKTINLTKFNKFNFKLKK